MMLACVQGNLEYCQWLFVRVGSNKEILQCGNNETNVPMDWACINGHLAVGEWFVDEDACNMIEIYSKNKVTLMHIVCLYGHLDVCQWLFDKGADIQTLANDGEMPMHWACINGHLAVCEWLFDKGTDIKAFNNHGDSPMHHTCIGGHLDVCQWLFDKGTDIQTFTKNKQTPMHMACRFGHLEVCQWLFEKGADIQLFTGDGDSLVHLASYDGYLAVCEWLFKNGADIKTPCYGMASPIYTAFCNEHLSLFKWFLSNGALNVSGGNKVDLDAITPVVSKFEIKALLKLLKTDINIVFTLSCINKFTQMALDVRTEHNKEHVSKSMAVIGNDTDLEVKVTCTPTEYNFQSMPLEVVRYIVDFVVYRYPQCALNAIESLNMLYQIRLINTSKLDEDHLILQVHSSIEDYDDNLFIENNPSEKLITLIYDCLNYIDGMTLPSNGFKSYFVSQGMRPLICPDETLRDLEKIQRSLKRFKELHSTPSVV